MKKYIEVETARDLILSDLDSDLPSEQVDILTALGRILCQDVVADRDLPPTDNSAMDGYGLRSQDSPDEPQGSVRMSVVAIIPAGKPWPGKVLAGETVRIMTGAPIPDGVDSVIRREFVEELDDAIILERLVPLGNDIRRAGEDIRAGEIVLAKGSRVTPATVGMLAAVGMPYVTVVRQPKVAVLATGDEIVDFHQVPGPGAIRNSNSFSMAALVKQAGAIPQVFPITRDEPVLIRQALLDAVSGSDLVLTSGGVSMGDFDFLQDVIRDLPDAEIRFWQVKMKPGKPVLYSRISGTPVIGLPGNPVSTMVSFEQFVRPLLKKMAGFPESEWLLVKEKAIVTETLSAPGDRLHYARGVAERDHDGRLTVKSTGSQGSGILNSMVRGNCLIIQPPSDSGAPKGSKVEIEWLGY